PPPPTRGQRASCRAPPPDGPTSPAVRPPTAPAPPARPEIGSRLDGAREDSPPLPTAPAGHGCTASRSPEADTAPPHAVDRHPHPESVLGGYLAPRRQRAT